MPPFIHVGELFDNYLIIVDKGVALLLLFGYLALAFFCMYLANKPQPKPSAALWNYTGPRRRRRR
jgi:hypothetical protein